jgi:hypothetical protein
MARTIGFRHFLRERRTHGHPHEEARVPAAVFREGDERGRQESGSAVTAL